MAKGAANDARFALFNRDQIGVVRLVNRGRRRKLEFEFPSDLLFGPGSGLGLAPRLRQFGFHLCDIDRGRTGGKGLATTAAEQSRSSRSHLP